MFSAGNQLADELRPSRTTQLQMASDLPEKYMLWLKWQRFERTLQPPLAVVVRLCERRGSLI